MNKWIDDGMNSSKERCTLIVHLLECVQKGGKWFASQSSTEIFTFL